MNRFRFSLYRVAAFVGCIALGSCAPTKKETDGVSTDWRENVQHVVVFYQENWSFDGLYGRFPNANGIVNASAESLRQLDKSGQPYTMLPPPLDNSKPPKPDPRFPPNLPVRPFDLKEYVPLRAETGDLVHRFYQNQRQINGGTNNQFVAWSDNGGLVMSYVDSTGLPEGKLASEFTLADNFFQSAFGGSFLNHIWLIAASTARWPDAPSTVVAVLDPKTGELMKDGAVTPDGFAVNTCYAQNPPYPAFASNPKGRIPAQKMPTIGDRLTEKGVSWAWYAGGWNDAVNGKPDPTFQFHHQPFNYFENYSVGKPGRAHLKDLEDFKTAIASDQLPGVSFVKQLGEANEHPGYASVQEGQEAIAALVEAIQKSPAWKSTVIIITYDENGGRWDHVAPPLIDRWGPGTRVPTIVVSPWARKHFVDHTPYETVSILKFIEDRWGLAPLSDRDAKANSLLGCLTFR